MYLIAQLLISGVIFLILSKTLPGFDIKDFKTALLVALLYGIFMLLAAWLATPLAFLSNALVQLVSWIPIIGKLANIGNLVLMFLLKFIIGSIMLCITDGLLKGFKMKSFAVGIVASLIISLVGCFIPMF